MKTVDLGLPSGTLWTSCNVGAKSVEDYGKYFTFEEASKLSNKEYGVPTIEQIKELVKCCTYEYTNINGIYGILVTGPNSNNIFLPSSGYCSISSGALYSVGSYGNYWSATLYNTYYGRYLYFGSSYWCWSNNFRAYGFSVRLVKNSKSDLIFEKAKLLHDIIEDIFPQLKK